MSRNGLNAIHALNARIADIDVEIVQARAEADMLRHIDDDAQRDSLVTDNAEDQQDARRTKRDVLRADRYVVKLLENRAVLVAKRDHAIDKLARG